MLDSHSRVEYSSSTPSTQEDAFLSKYDGGGGGELRAKSVGYYPCMLEPQRSHYLAKVVKSGTPGGSGHGLCRRTH